MKRLGKCKAAADPHGRFDQCGEPVETSLAHDFINGGNRDVPPR